MSRTCKILLHGNKDFAEVIKSRLLKWGDDPGLSGMGRKYSSAVQGYVRERQGCQVRKGGRDGGSRERTKDATTLWL